MEERIARLAAQVYAGSDWHRLLDKERELTSLLEDAGYLVPNKPANGFVGDLPEVHTMPLPLEHPAKGKRVD